MASHRIVVDRQEHGDGLAKDTTRAQRQSAAESDASPSPAIDVEAEQQQRKHNPKRRGDARAGWPAG